MGPSRAGAPAQASPSPPRIALMDSDETAALRLLRLLAEGAPASELSQVPDPEGEARELALRVRAVFDSRRRREAELTALVETPGTSPPFGTLWRPRGHRAPRPDPARDRRRLPHAVRPLGRRHLHAGHRRSVSTEFQTVRLSLGHGLGGLVAKTHKPYWTADYFNDHRFQHTGTIDSAVGHEGLVSICGTPLLVEGEFVGVLFASNRSPRPFSPDQVALLGPSRPWPRSRSCRPGPRRRRPRPWRSCPRPTSWSAGTPPGSSGPPPPTTGSRPWFSRAAASRTSRPRSPTCWAGVWCCSGPTARC